MNQTASLTDRSPSQTMQDTLESRFGFRVAARLTEGSMAVEADVSERLRFAREQALERSRAARRAAVGAQATVRVGQTAALQGGQRWWFKLAAALPAVALAIGLVAIQSWQDSAQITTAAEIDAALLADDLPPAAYSDAGFVEYLKSTPSE